MNSFSALVDGWCSLQSALRSSTTWPCLIWSCANSWECLFRLVVMGSAFLPGWGYRRAGAGRRLGPGECVRVVAVQGLHQLKLGVAGQRGLEHGSAVRPQRLGELLRGGLAHDHHEGRRSRLYQVLDALPEVVFDAEA